MAQDDDRKVFVGGLTDTATDAMLRGLFVDAGVKVVDVSVPRDRTTGRARGFGFVTLGTSADADTAVQELDGKLCDGRAISVRAFQSKGAGPPSQRSATPHAPAASVYIANLPFDASEAEVVQAFLSRGIRVADVRIPRERGAGRGYGFVNLEKADDVAKAVAEVDGMDLKGRPMVVKTVRPRGALSDGPPSAASHSRHDAAPHGGGPHSGRVDAERRYSAPPPSVAPAPGPAPDWGDAEGADRRRTQKPKKKEAAKVKATGRPRSSKERSRAGADWSRRYDHWDDD